MKKIFIYIIFIVGVCFLIPLIGVYKFENEDVVSLGANENNEETQNVKDETNEEKKEDNNQEEYNYKQYGTIKLLHVGDESVEELNIDEYLYGVVSSEMPANFEQEALKAQAVVARTYTIYKITGDKKHENSDICDDSKCCQAWISKEKRLERWEEGERETNWNKVVEAVNSTKGKIVTYNGEPINAFFHANSGGTTEAPINVWGGSGYPYLQSVATSGEENYSQYSSEVILSKKEFENKIREKYSDFKIDWTQEKSIEVLEYTNGNRIKTIKVGNKNLAGVEVRTILGLKSANFEISIEEEKIRFNVKGYGHGVGMSQTGADSLAKQGKNYEEIIKHFYVGVEIKNI